jgi:N-acetylglucosamine-6-phosphate deacetylase
MAIALTAERIFDGEKFYMDSAVLVEKGKVLSVISREEILPGDEVKNLGDKIIAPAFLDLQIYGAHGKMFSQDLDSASISATNDYCRAGGASSFMITMATNSMENFYKGIDAVKKYWEEGGKGCLGLHMEGPYLNPEKKGAHIERYIKKPTVEEINEIIKRGEGIVKMITIAPEFFDLQMVRQLKEAGMLVSAGHTNATYQQAMDGFDSGIPVATHLFNAMSSFMHRAPGMVGAILDHPIARASIVCDGIHVDYAAVRVAHRIMQNRLFFITDAVTEVSGGEYPHMYKGDRYVMPDGTLSGSSLTMFKCIQNAVNHARVPLDVALSMATATPASLLAEEIKLGKIQEGFPAEFAVMDNALESVDLLTF